ncbi:MAG: tetratricopeptide repeat protein, partial [Terriglobales bacterium]
MPLHSVDTATYQVRSAHTHSPSVVLLTDETALERLPAPLRAATNQIWLGSRLGPEPPAGICGWLRWGQGERLLQGTAAQVRFAFTVPDRRFFLPVHYQCGDWELLGLEPRCFTSGAGRTDSIDLRVRIAAAPPGDGDAVAEDSAAGEPWQRLAAALRLEAAQLGAGIAPLARLAQTPGLHPTLHALGLRNLVVALLRQNEREQAEKLLRQAQAIYPTYRELDYLFARLMLALGRGGEAIASLQRATMPAPAAGAAPEPVFVGSGGESGYRAHYLLALLAEHTGRQQVALHHFLSGVRQLPAYPPSVSGLMRQRLAVEAFAAVQWELTRLGRREPQYQAPIFSFFLLHRAFEAAENLLRVWRLTPEAHTQLAARLQALAPLYRATRRAPDTPAGIVLAGPILMHSSVARINRYLAAALRTDPGLELALEPTSPGEEPAAAFPRAALWAPALTHLPARLDLTIRHGWPPDFHPPAT